MTDLSMLWLPILVSAAFVFIVSSVIHMFTGWHANDYRRIPDEDRVRDTIRPLNIPPGDYMIPKPSSAKDLSAPDFTEKMKKGPVMMISMWESSPPNMGPQLVGWFIYSCVVGLFAAYIAGRALPPGADYLAVFRFSGATAFLGYAAALWQMSIWYKRPWGTTLKISIDGLIYALLTGGTFGWLWPAL
jgi:hypothetical protein